MPYDEYNDPYIEVCDFWREGSAFGEDFACSRNKGHLNSHYDEFTNSYERNA